MIKKILFFMSVSVFCSVVSLVQAAGSRVPLQTVKVDLHDQAALQRGARLFMNYCSGCHSMQYLRYNRMAKDIGIVTSEGRVDDALLRENLMFDAKHNVGDVIKNTMPKEKSKQWFGVTPPDLSLIARVRGADWLYTYLMSFYEDKSKAWGVDNLVFASVSMPDVLLGLRGKQVPVYRTATQTKNGQTEQYKILDHLQVITPGTQSPAQFKRSMQDLVTFLVYASEPMKLQRFRIGLGVIVFLMVLFVLMVLLKRAYWKGIK